MPKEKSKAHGSESRERSRLRPIEPGKTNCSSNSRTVWPRRSNRRRSPNPLLSAGMILEGGIIGYDTNIETGGNGARYPGIGTTNPISKR